MAKFGKKWVVLASSRCPKTEKLLQFNSVHPSEEEANAKLAELKTTMTLVYEHVIFTKKAPYIASAKKIRCHMWNNPSE